MLLSRNTSGPPVVRGAPGAAGGRVLFVGHGALEFFHRPGLTGPSGLLDLAQDGVAAVTQKTADFAGYPIMVGREPPADGLNFADPAAVLLVRLKDPPLFEGQLEHVPEPLDAGFQSLH